MYIHMYIHTYDIYVTKMAATTRNKTIHIYTYIHMYIHTYVHTCIYIVSHVTKMSTTTSKKMKADTLTYAHRYIDT